MADLRKKGEEKNEKNMKIMSHVAMWCLDVTTQQLPQLKKASHLMTCNTPKYTLVIFNMFRIFCRHKLKFS